MRLSLLLALTAPALVLGQTSIQAYLGVSQSCANTLLSLTSDPQLSCLSVGALTNVAVNFTDISTMTAALNQVCGTAPCSDTVIQNVTSTINSTCAGDIASKQPLPYAVYVALELYQPLYQSACLRNSTGGYCILETIQHYSNYVQANSTGNVNGTAGLVGGDWTSVVNSIPNNVLCTVCNKNTLNLLGNYVQNHTNVFGSNTTGNITALNNALSQKCNVTNFLDGTTNANATSLAALQNSTNGSSSPSGSSTVSVSYSMMLVSAVAVAAAVAMM